jgi:large subunit ribosomal protein L15
LLGKGELTAKLSFKVAGASQGAIAAVEKAGGSVEVTALKKAADAEAPKKPAKAKAKPADDEEDEAPAAAEEATPPAAEEAGEGE